MYRSYSVNNMPEPVMYNREKKPECKPPEKKPEEKKPHKGGGLLDNIQNDDIILLAVILLLLMDDCSDKLLLAALAFIFLSDSL